jgi:hypothetical protein
MTAQRTDPRFNFVFQEAAAALGLEPELVRELDDDPRLLGVLLQARTLQALQRAPSLPCDQLERGARALRGAACLVEPEQSFQAGDLLKLAEGALDEAPHRALRHAAGLVTGQYLSAERLGRLLARLVDQDLPCAWRLRRLPTRRANATLWQIVSWGDVGGSSPEAPAPGWQCATSSTASAGNKEIST